MTMTPDPADTLAIADEWDDATLASLHDDGPRTTSELVLVPRYTQSEWDREQVRKLHLIGATAADMRANLHVKSPEALIYDALLKLECYRMAALIYPAVSGLDELPRRHREARERENFEPVPPATEWRKPQPPRGEGGRFIPAGGAS